MLVPGLSFVDYRCANFDRWSMAGPRPHEEERRWGRQVPSTGSTLRNTLKKQCLRRSSIPFKQSLNSSSKRQRRKRRRERQKRLKGSAGGLLAAGCRVCGATFRVESDQAGQAGTEYLASWGAGKDHFGVRAFSRGHTPRALGREECSMALPCGPACQGARRGHSGISPGACRTRSDARAP